MAEYSPPKSPRGTIFNQGDFLYLYQPLKYITNIGTGSKVYKETFEGTARLRTVTSSYMTIAQNANEIDLASNGILRMANGTNSAPSYSFSTDTDTGIHRPSANNLHLVAGGSDIIRCSNTLGVTLPSGLSCLNSGRYLSSQIGTASNPTYQYYDGTLNDSGIFFKSSTWEPSISHKSTLVAEFGTSLITCSKPIDSTSQPTFQWVLTANQPITASTTTDIDFVTSTPTRSRGTGLTYNTGTKTFTVSSSGYWLVSWRFVMEAGTAGAYSIWLETGSARRMWQKLPFVSAESMIMQSTDIVFFNTNDTFILRVFQNTSGTRNIANASHNGVLTLYKIP